MCLRKKNGSRDESQVTKSEVRESWQGEIKDSIGDEENQNPDTENGRKKGGRVLDTFHGLKGASRPPVSASVPSPLPLKRSTTVSQLSHML